MPRTSERQRQLRDLEQILDDRADAAMIRYLLDQDDELEDEVDELVHSRYIAVLSARYVARLPYRKREDRWRVMLHDRWYMTSREFLEHFRLSRDAFWRIVRLVQDDPVFQQCSHRTFRGNAELHLMVLLKFLGCCGNENTASKLALFFGLGKGSIDNYLRRAAVAVMKLRGIAITWPDQDERKVIAQNMKMKYGFINCVGLTDGTLLPLEFKPTKNGEDYYTRKGGYALNALVTCDDATRIRDIVVGWPGCTHDNRVWSNCSLNRDSTKYFSEREYLLGDSAFQPSDIMVPAFKKPPKGELDQFKTYFNTQLAKARIKTEHCIGVLKARFQYLKRSRVIIKTKTDMKRLIEFILCACILHNLLIAEPAPWEIECIQDELDEDDELNTAVPRDAPGDERRIQVFCYILETKK